MVDIKDLRLGNWVYDGEKAQFPMRVETLGDDYVYLDFDGNEGDVWESTSEDIHGIPITRQLLEKLGFKENCYYYYHLDENNYLQYYFHEHRLRRYYEGKDEWNNHPHVREISFECRGIHYLHQLQNAFYMATQQELKVNL